MNNLYYILTDDREERGCFTKWAVTNDLKELEKFIEYFKKSLCPEKFIIYDQGRNAAGRLLDAKITFNN